MPLPLMSPPLINSANPWCSSQEDLQALYDSPSTGAVTTRTSLLQGFGHDPAIHQHTFFDPRNHDVLPYGGPDYAVPDSKCGSLNTLGYSPTPLREYLKYISAITTASTGRKKPFIISVTGSPDEIRQCYDMITEHQQKVSVPLCMEINLSCPNIPSKPPPAYSKDALIEYFIALSRNGVERTVPIGIKTPPYTYHDQFASLLKGLLSASVLEKGNSPIDFVTTTNTLGSCLLLDNTTNDAALASASGAGVGGMAGAPLHPLALGNVKTIRALLDEHESLKMVDIIGVGGVGDKAGFDRMMSVGAKLVGVGTALGREGVKVFDHILA
ncbi:hypothetical protein AAFC00_005556 [Neodothiora populina]|uniref:Dihydroorotate dehydrogenase (fumarate) n=1 Tax=Neodothiora populina TaxID=2781224 RepID=A0ABR3PL98_9PEZI